VRDRLDRCRNLEAAEIRATKDVSSVRRCGDEPDVNRDGSVQSDSVSINGTPQRGLFDQLSGPLSQTFIHVSPLESNRCADVNLRF